MLAHQQQHSTFVFLKHSNVFGIEPVNASENSILENERVARWLGSTVLNPPACVPLSYLLAVFQNIDIGRSSLDLAYALGRR
jgi:hypothetical protein